MTNLETNSLEILTREAVRFCSRAVRLFLGPARANAYGPHTGLSSMVLQRKRSQGRTGHMINYPYIMIGLPGMSDGRER